MVPQSGGEMMFDSADTLRLKNFFEIALSRSVFEINVFLHLTQKLEDGHQKWRENDFCEKSAVDSADTLWVKIFVEMALSRSLPEINVFLLFQR